MVGFKKFFLATSLLLGWVVAAPTSEVTELNVLEERDLSKGSNAAQVCESKFVLQADITNNGGSATVVDLTGCTALFFYTGNTLNSAYHIYCGGNSQATDAEVAGEANYSSDYVVVVASSAAIYNSIRDGIKNGNPNIIVGALTIYSFRNLPSGKAIAVTATTGSRDTTQATVDIVCAD